jgi:hypothetical protein
VWLQCKGYFVWSSVGSHQEKCPSTSHVSYRYCVTGTPAPLTTTIVTTRWGGLAIEEPKKRRPSRRPNSELMAEDENSLYYIIRQGKVSLRVGIFMLSFSVTSQVNLSLRSALFWGITQCRVVILNRCFGTTYWSHLQGSRSPRRVESRLSSLLGLIDPWRWDWYVVPKCR